MVAHNASFDMSFIMENCRRLGYPQEFTYVDTVGISRVLLKNQSKHTLDAVAKTLGISLENHHRAVDDAECTAHIFVKYASPNNKKLQYFLFSELIFAFRVLGEPAFFHPIFLLKDLFDGPERREGKYA